MKIQINKDGEGFLAKVEGQDNLFAFAYSKQEAISELKNVIDMIMDFHLEQLNIERLAKKALDNLHAV
ncbi:MAG: hypothetical protein MAG581_02199 [Deltaproteobacteria bacterium]|jgi:predicted RNase H-like HicB family nuclease|nr:hypothetical protein [Deltaproteobacteria bacterium]